MNGFSIKQASSVGVTDYTIRKLMKLGELEPIKGITPLRFESEDIYRIERDLSKKKKRRKSIIK